jgi:ribonuclease BN (tRNA processing enzyme)
MDTIRRGFVVALTWALATLLAHGECAAQPAPPGKGGAVFITLGTRGGPIAARERSGPANAVLVGDAAYLFDVGDGVQRQLAGAGISLEHVRAIFISHHHIDHNAGLAPILITRWVLGNRRALPVIGPPGTVSLARGIVRAYRATELAPVTFGVREVPLASTVKPTDLPPILDDPMIVYADENISVRAITNDHFHFPKGSREQRFSRSYSYRIEALDRTIVYTGDTGASPHVARLAAGADLLVSEVIDTRRMVAAMTKAAGPPDPRQAGLIAHMERDHLLPSEVARIAAQAGVKSLVLTHFVPGDDGEVDLTGYTRGISSIYRGPVHLARDLDRF